MKEIKFEHIAHSDSNKIRFGRLVKQLDHEYLPPISSLVDDLQVYVEKMIKNAIVVIAKYNKEDIGFIATYCNDTNQKTAYITSLSIKKEFQSKKIGRKLVEIAIADAVHNGMLSIELEVQQENILAIGFYEKLGFIKKITTKDKSVIMQLDLEEHE